MCCLILPTKYLQTPVFQKHSQPGSDLSELKQLLVKLIRDEYSSTRPVIATKPNQSSASNEQEENVQAADEGDISGPICTTLDDFISFEKWASTPQFKTVGTNMRARYKIGQPVKTSSSLDDYAEYAFVAHERVERNS
ncbi:hypothetical protein BDW75DRAFT_246251 [Aspergillus navahoensis]